MAARTWTSVGLGAYHAAERHAMVLPGGYKGDATQRGVIFCHSRGGDATQATDVTSSSFELIRAIAAAGFPVICTDLGGGTTWGNDTAIARVSESKTFLQGTWGAKAGSVFLVGQSMGHPAALNWARQNLASVAAVVGVLPIVDLADVYASNGTYAADMDVAYGGTYVDADQKALHNPAYYVTQGDLAGLAWQGWYASDDTTAKLSKITPFVAAIGATASATSVGALGHTAAAVNAIPFDAVTAFLAAHA